MKMKGIRESLGDYESDLQQIISKASLESNHDENNYRLLSQVLQFIRSNTDTLNPESLKEVIFLLGATGAGKSTLLNYLMLEDAKFVLSEGSEDDIQLSTEIDTGVEIGNGEGSTTLFPNLRLTPFGNFLDCAGEGDTGGVLAEVINSIIKRKIASNVEQAKILFVSQQTSLGSGGGYGANFKQALDKNSQFLRDINYFKESMGLVITKAGVASKVLERCGTLLQNILKHHSSSGNYKEIIEEIFQNQKFVTFSKPFKLLEEGEFYSPPSWNLNQKNNIINMICDMPFAPIPKKDFFNTSSTPQVRETMQKAMQVVVLKAGDFINQMVVNAQPFTIFSVEMKPFAKYASGLMGDYSTELLNYLNVLSFNNYLKVKPNYESLEKINEELNFLSQFTQETDNENPEKLKVDWGKVAKVNGVFKNAYDGIQNILSTQGNNFSKFKAENNVKTIPSSLRAYDILNSFDNLYGKYKKLDEIKLLGKQQESKYYKDVIKKEYSHTKKVPYTDKEQYIDIQYEDVTEEYQVLEPYTVKEQKTRPVTKWKTETYTENEDQWNRVTKYRTEEYQTEENADGRTVALMLTTFGIGNAIKAIATGDPVCTNTVTRTREVPYDDWEKTTVKVAKTRDIPYTSSETYYEDVKKEKLVTKHKIVTKPKQVLKERDVTKYRDEKVFKDLTVRELDQDMYNSDLAKINNEIQELREKIKHDTDSYPKGKLGIHDRDHILSKDKYEKMYEDLQIVWQNAEYEAYFANNDNNSLEELDVNVIGDSLI